MKKDIHPQYYPNAQVHCACGNTFQVGSTQPSLEIEVCSACHPFYTGQDKLMDKVGRVQKFRERLAKKQAPKAKPLDKTRAVRGSEEPSGSRRGKKAKPAQETKGRARVTKKAAK